MPRAGRWSIAGLCIGAVAWPALGDGALDTMRASATRLRAPETPPGNCTTLMLNRASGLTTAARCPEDLLIRLEASGRRGGGAVHPVPQSQIAT